MNSFKPAGYTSLAPYLIVDGASQTVDFLVKAFDGVELRRMAGTKLSAPRLMESKLIWQK